MTDRFEAELRDRFDRLSGAVPLRADDEPASGGGRTARVGRAVWRSPSGIPATPLVALAILVVIGAGLAGLGRGGGPSVSTPPISSANPTTTAAGDARAVFPGACSALGLTPNRCAGFAAWAIGDAGLEPGHVQRIEMERVDCPVGSACPADATGYIVNVHLVTDRGGATDRVVSCTTIPGTLGGLNFLCDEFTSGDGRTLQYPRVSSPILGGYHDVPCSGEAPIGCATPLPTIEPRALAGAQPLTIAALAIPIDRAGPYSVVLGEASLPNGILTAASAEITSSPTDPLVGYDGYRLTISSLDGGPPFSNYYEHGWRQGTERVEVTLEFVVLGYQPGATVVISSVDVR